MIRLHWLSSSSSQGKIVLEMSRIVWQSQPVCFVGLILIELFKWVIPLGSAWVTKSLFDLLTTMLQSKNASMVPQSLLLLLIGQVALNVFIQILEISSSYLNSELGRQLNLKIQIMIYQKINSLAGLAPFEDPHFHDSIQLSKQGAMMGPSHMLDTLTNLPRILLTLIGFLGILITFSPFLAILVSVAALPQLYAELKLVRQRFDLAYENSPKERRIGYYSYVLSAVPFAKEIRMFDFVDYFLKIFQRLSVELHWKQRRQHLRELRWQLIQNLQSNLVSNSAFVIVVLRAFAGYLSLGDVTLYTSAVGSVQSSLAILFHTLTNTNESSLFFSRFTDLLALPQPIKIASQPHPVPPLTSAIEFRNLWFRYSDQHPWILRNINSTFAA